MRNAFIGYSYQQVVTLLMLSKMDVERKIDILEIEAKVDNKFDDLKITGEVGDYHLQMKDYEDVSFDDLVVKEGSLFIKGKPHKLSDTTNVLFLKSIETQPDCEILGFEAVMLHDVFIVSMSRAECYEKIDSFYESNSTRKGTIDLFFNELLDDRRFTIHRRELPTINVFSTELQEQTVNIGRRHLEFESILILEGKPGVGKSHYVSLLETEIENSFVYRFWISNQDNDYSDRLKFSSFLTDLSKRLFHDLIARNEMQIIEKFAKNQMTVIIDGLDHVENYNPQDLEQFIAFIELLKNHCKTIVLTRPLIRPLNWKTQYLNNWSREQTVQLLKERYQISNHKIIHQIFDITNGYPILVRYVSEHYQINGELPQLENLDSVEDYYGKIIRQEKGKQSLTLFLCTRSYLMRSEIEFLLDSELSLNLLEFIKEHPYLFEIRLNRLSLFHDSFTTYLRNQGINYSIRQQKVHEIVSSSILNMEKRFLSRSALFDLDVETRKQIVIKYASIQAFKELIKNVIDFESIQAFYFHLREELALFESEELDIYQYYDFALIINIVGRDHISSLNPFLYTYTKALLFNGYTEEDITSSRYLFAMLFYVRTGDSVLLQNVTADDFYSTQNFHDHLSDDVRSEQDFFARHRTALSASRVNELLSAENRIDSNDRIIFILENVYVHSSVSGVLKALYDCIANYMEGNRDRAIYSLERALEKYGFNNVFSRWILDQVEENILASGLIPEKNEYKQLSLEELILKHKDKGSFYVWPKILSYLRLSLHDERKVDISSIAIFWPSYYQRKDYSFYALPQALRVFEQKRKVHRAESCELIISIQEISEKGYRGLLEDYVRQSDLTIINYLNENFEIKNLRIEWFHLPAEYINILPDRMFNIAMNDLIKEHHYNRLVDFEDVVNLLESNRKGKLKSNLDFLHFGIRIEKSNPLYKQLEAEGFLLIEKEHDPYDQKEDDLERLNQGILTEENKNLIKSIGLEPYQVAGFSNGNYTALTDLDIYDEFEKEKITHSVQSILHSGLLGKNYIGYFHYPYYFPGNVPALLLKYNVEVDFDKLFDSFNTFLNLSLFELKANSFTPNAQDI